MKINPILQGCPGPHRNEKHFGRTHDPFGVILIESEKNRDRRRYRQARMSVRNSGFSSSSIAVTLSEGRPCRIAISFRLYP